MPLMGVCLGHQAIGEAFGGNVVRCHEIVHGKMGAMHHTGKGLFAGLPSPFEATRYHSLVVERDTLPDCLEITAELEDGTIMGLQHRELPIHGVQFHPESIRSEHGHQLLQNFLAKTEGARMSDAMKPLIFAASEGPLIAVAGGRGVRLSCLRAPPRPRRSAGF